MDLIKHYMYDLHLYDRQIIDLLRKEGITMPESTLYDYKHRIQQEESEIWDKIAVDSTKYRAVRLIRSLEEGVRLNEQIRDNPNNSVKERQESSKLVSIFEKHIYLLVSQGLDFKQIPLVKTIPISYNTTSIEDKTNTITTTITSDTTNNTTIEQ